MAILRKKFGVGELTPFQPAEILDWGPLYWSVAGSSQSVSPTGSAFLTFGAPTVTSRLTVSASGASFLTFGTTVVVAGPGPTQTIYPTGIANLAFGTVTIYNTRQYVLPGGIAPNPQTGPNSAREVPPPTIDYRNKYVTPTGISVPVGQIPTHYVADYYQFIDTAGRGAGPETLGTAFVAYKVRTIFPSFIVSDLYGTPLVGRTMYVHPSGFGGEAIPITHLAEDYSNRIAPHSGGADPAGYGVASVRNAKLFVYPNTSAWGGSQVNFPILYNKKQVLSVRQFQDTDAEVAKYGVALVENRNRTVYAFGHSDSRFSYYAANVYNKAEAVVPVGLGATLFGSALIAHRIRTVFPQGFDSFYTQQPGTIVFNAARVVAPNGFRSDIAPSVAVFNRNRTVSQFFPYSGETFGTSFVAYRVRTLVQQPFNDVPASLPEVRFNPHPISAIGIGSYGTGGAFVYIHRNEVFPRSANVRPTDAVGEAFIQNRNKTITPYAYEQTTFGWPAIENYIRNIYPPTLPSTQHGATDISRRTKELAPASFSSHVASIFTQVRNVIPDPPGQQTILPPSFSVSDEIGTPTCKRQTLFPTSIPPSTVPSPTVRDTNLRPVWVFDDYIGTPTMVSTQYLRPKYIPSATQPGQGESDLFATKHSVSPHTIYAPSADQATTQAKQNNGENAEIIDNVLWNAYPYHFGEAKVSNRNRTIYPQSPTVVSSVFGTHTTALKIRRVYPLGSRFVRFGAHNLNGAQEILANGFEVAHDFGSANIYSAYFSPYVRPSGFDASDYGRPDVDNFHRNVYPTGYEQTTFGVAEVHPPRRLGVVGFVATHWGDTMVSYKNRFVHPQGFNAFLSSDHLPGFNDRMRVRLATPTPPTPTYSP